jgi:glycosyltransferase involved in cell wall biosynthesis
VDVAIPCFNYGRFLHDSVGSVLAQQGVSVRVLVIDNASTDDSLAVARSLAAADPRVTVVAHERNMGASYSYNRGIDWAESDYFLLLDADDLLALGALARAISVMEADPGIAFTYGIEVRLEAGQELPRLDRSSTGITMRSGAEFVADLCSTPVNCVGANTVVRRTSVQKAIGHYRASLPYTDDLEMWLRLATRGKVAFIHRPQAIRRYHQSRHSAHYLENGSRDIGERRRAFESFFANEGRGISDSARLLASARRGLAEHAYWSAVAHLARGQTQAAADLWRYCRQHRRGLPLPPIRWLLRMDRPLGRTGEVIREAFHRLQSRHRTLNQRDA